MVVAIAVEGVLVFKSGMEGGRDGKPVASLLVDALGANAAGDGLVKD